VGPGVPEPGILVPSAARPDPVTGRIAQLVQSACLTRRMSGVRIPLRPLMAVDLLRRANGLRVSVMRTAVVSAVMTLAAGALAPASAQLGIARSDQKVLALWPVPGANIR